MSSYAYERLSAQDATFLWAEGENEPMHIGAVAVYETGPLATESGGLDIARYRAAIESVLHWIPRYRQKIQWTPLERWPIWVDDRQFELGYHIRHIALPAPGRLEQLKELTGRIFSRRLDRARPLWEIWVIEGLEGGEQFAVLNKIHHCMLDGAAGADLSQILMSPSARVEPREAVPYMPRPVPSGADLLRDAVAHGVRRSLAAARQLLGARDEAAAGAGPGLERRLRAMAEMVRYVLQPASQTPINGPLGPHRHLEWITMPLEDVHELRRVLGCSVNDVVLATVTEAMRRYLFRRRVDPRRLDFRVAAPVSVRRAEHDRRQGNHVSTWIVPLPIRLDDPKAQLDAIRATTESLKKSEASLAVATLMQAAEWLPAPILARSTRIAQGPANMIVTNVPGPQFPLYSVGARLLGMYPLVPLLPQGGLGVALFSYEGKLCWGFNADRELVPDPAAFVSDVLTAFEKLRGAAVTEYMSHRTGRDAEAPTAKRPERPRRKAADAKPARARARRTARHPSGEAVATPPH